MRFDVVGEQGAEVLAIVVVDEAVAEDAQRLVAPQAREDFLARDGGGLHHEHALDHLVRLRARVGVGVRDRVGVEVGVGVGDRPRVGARVRFRVRVRALDHLADVAQVEGVVRLGRDRLEVAEHAEEEVDLGGYGDIREI